MDQYQKDIIAMNKFYLTKWNKATNDDLPLPAIEFNLTGFAAGQFVYQTLHNIIVSSKLRYNKYIYHTNNHGHFLTNTVPHEIAHYIAITVYGIKEGKGHNNCWKTVMSLLGAEAKKYHEYKCEAAWETLYKLDQLKRSLLKGELKNKKLVLPNKVLTKK